MTSSCLVIAVLLLSVSVVWSRTSKSNISSPPPATVVSSEVAVLEDVGESAQKYYEPEITYEYSVDGTTYRTSKLFPGSAGEKWKPEDYGGQEWANEIVNEHPLGRRVSAYYDPADPSKAFLLQNRNWTLLWPMVVGLICLVVWGWNFYHSSRPG